MARIRSMKPEFWIDEKLANSTSRDARLMYIGLWNLADEHSRLRGSPAYIKGQLFTYDDDLTPSVVGRLVDELETAGAVERYEVDGETYIYLPKLARHQRLEPDKVPSRLPSPPLNGHQSEPRANESAPISDESAPRTEDHALLYVAGYREHVAGSRGKELVAQKRATTTPDPAVAFDEFWKIYPRREAKAAARKAWDKAIKRADPGAITEGARRYRDDPGRDPKFTAHAATWLNADRWTDEPLPRGSPNGRPSTTDQRVTAALALAEQFERLEIEP